jgi:hypothetical protein
MKKKKKRERNVEDLFDVEGPIDARLKTAWLINSEGPGGNSKSDPSMSSAERWP